MMKRDEAEQLGWQFALGTEKGTAIKNDRQFNVASSIPLFMLLAHVAEAEGRAFLKHHGGDQEVTPQLVADISGENYVPPPVEPPVPAKAEVLASILESDLSDAEKFAKLAKYLRGE